MILVVRKPAFCICENKDADQLHGAKLICVFVFATRILQSLNFLNPKFQDSSHLLLLYSLVCVGPGRNSRRPVFSQRGSYENDGSRAGVRVCVCVRLFTLSNINISATSGPIATKFYLKYHWGGGKDALGSGPDRIGTLVSMATDSLHRVIMGKIL